MSMGSFSIAFATSSGRRVFSLQSYLTDAPEPNLLVVVIVRVLTAAITTEAASNVSEIIEFIFERVFSQERTTSSAFLSDPDRALGSC